MPINPNVDLHAGFYDRPHNQLHGVGPRLPLLPRPAQHSRAWWEVGSKSGPSQQEQQQRPAAETETRRTAADAEAAVDAPAPPDAPADASPLVGHMPSDDAVSASCRRAPALTAFQQKSGTTQTRGSTRTRGSISGGIISGDGIYGGSIYGGGGAASVAPAAHRLSSTGGQAARRPRSTTSTGLACGRRRAAAFGKFCRRRRRTCLKAQPGARRGGRGGSNPGRSPQMGSRCKAPFPHVSPCIPMYRAQLVTLHCK